MGGDTSKCFTPMIKTTPYAEVVKVMLLEEGSTEALNRDDMEFVAFCEACSEPPISARICADSILDYRTK